MKFDQRPEWSRIKPSGKDLWEEIFQVESKVSAKALEHDTYLHTEYLQRERRQVAWSSE